jgi:regulator of sigma D
VATRNLRLDEYNEKLNQLIDRLLNQILGHEAAQIIYSYLESNHSIQRHEIAQKLNSFNEALEGYLGSGAFVIEKAILASLEENKDIDFDRHKILKLA